MIRFESEVYIFACGLIIGFLLGLGGTVLVVALDG